MGTKNISLPRDLDEYVQAKVASGEYAHASEVVRDGIRLMMQQESEKLEWLREAVREGLEAPIRYDLSDSASVVAEVQKQARALSKTRKRVR